MDISGLHILLTYQCTFECDHCFVWGSPWQTGTLTLAQIRSIFGQAGECRSIDTIYFEGGEPFLYYPVLVKAVQEAHRLGYQVGLVTNSFWATSLEDALTWLAPFAGQVQDLSLSSDLYHYSQPQSEQVERARQAAEQLGIPVGTIHVAQPQNTQAPAASGQLPEAESRIMFRGRAVEQLAGQAPHHPWETFTTCPFENLRDPGRLHLDPLGNLSVCQGINLGNLFERPLTEILATYDPDNHSVTGPLLAGGPVALVRRYHLPHAAAYADACHLCYSSRLALRPRFPTLLGPDQVYGLLAS